MNLVPMKEEVLDISNRRITIPCIVPFLHADDPVLLVDLVVDTKTIAGSRCPFQ
jgi:hypothetical protein